MRQDSGCATQMDELGCLGGRLRSTLMSVRREQIKISVHLSLYELDFTMTEKLSWLSWMAPWTSKCADGCCNKVCYHGKEAPSRITLSWSKIMLCPHRIRATMDFLENQDVDIMDCHPKVGIWTLQNTSGYLWLGNRLGLPWCLLGLGPRYETCGVECVLSSLRVVATPTINPLLCHQSLIWTYIFFNISSLNYWHYSLMHITVTSPWHHCTLPASARKLLTLALLLPTS